MLHLLSILLAELVILDENYSEEMLLPAGTAERERYSYNLKKTNRLTYKDFVIGENHS